MKISDYLVEFLAQKGAKTIFGYQGSSVAHIIDSISKNSKVEYIQLYHEQAAGFAANGYASTESKKFGVAVACSGPGSTNLVTSIANAFYDSIPCFFITGQVGTGGIRSNKKMRQLGFQETDIVEMIAPISKYAVRVDSPRKIAIYLEEAYNAMISGRKGPVLIDIPHNIQASNIDVLDLLLPNTKKECIELCKSQVSQVARMMQKASKPIILVGGGLTGEVCKDTLKKVVKKWNIPVVTSYRGKDRFDNFDDNYIGVIGVYGNRCANIAVRYCDFLLVLGSRVDGRQTGDDIDNFAKDADIVYVDIDPVEIEEKPDRYLKIHANLEDFLKYFLDVKVNVKIDNWRKSIQYLKKKFCSDLEYDISSGVNPKAFCRDLTLYIKNKNAFITTDVGQNQIWFNSSGIVGEKCKVIQSCGLGAMGYSLPAAIGAYFSDKRDVLSINGDGGIQMNIQELQTIARENIPIKIFIFNNKSLGLIRVYQEKALNGNLIGSVDGFESPDYEKIAAAYGIKYYKINSNDYSSIISDIVEKKEPVLTEIMVSEKSTAYPAPAYKCAVYNQEPLLKVSDWEEIEEIIYEK